jgi:CysZ protein
MKNTPITGFYYFKRGIQGLRLKPLRPFVVIPVAINVVIYGIVMVLAYGKMNEWNQTVLDYLPEWLNFLTWLLWPMFILMLLVIMAYSFTIVANLIASPFNGLLSEKTENIMLNKDVPSPTKLVDWVLLVPRALGREVVKWMYFLPIILGLIILTFVPVINLITPALWFVFGAWSMAIQYCDFCADNHQQSFAAMKRGLKTYRWAYLGFGATVAAVSVIPLANLLVMPAAVIGASLMWSENNLNDTNSVNHQEVTLR